MTHRTEKPSATESSTDTLIGALETIAKVLDDPQGGGLYTTALLEAAQRLNKLEIELGYAREAARSEADIADKFNEKLKAGTKTLRDEFAMSALNGIIGQCRTEWDYHNACRVSYLFADAMMGARKCVNGLK